MAANLVTQELDDATLIDGVPTLVIEILSAQQRQADPS
jgi:hypothetical protein